MFSQLHCKLYLIFFFQRILSLFLFPLLCCLILHVVSVRSQRVIPGYVRMWYECKRECVRVTLICEWPCRIFAISRLDFKFCAIECKMDRLECQDECNSYLFRKLPSRYLPESRRRLYRPENESEPIAKRRGFGRRRFRRINSDLKWGNCHKMNKYLVLFGKMRYQMLYISDLCWLSFYLFFLKKMF